MKTDTSSTEKTKILYVTSLSGRRINRFMKSAIVAAKELGFQFDMACNMESADQELYELDSSYYGIRVFDVPFHRNPLSPYNLKAKRKLIEIIDKNKYDIIHCNTPVGGLLGRICSKKRIKTVIYQAHGFHFWKGAPLKNWIIYYNVEKRLAKLTDYLVTINNDDYSLSKRFSLKEKGCHKLIHGVGIEKINQIDSITKESIRQKLNIGPDKRVYISIGELNKNKNHQIVINALAKLPDQNYVYLICGEGAERPNLRKLIKKENLDDRVFLLGYRNDVDQLLQISDLFIFPSFREGLPISVMEAIECNIPCSASRIRGVVDLLPESDLLFDPHDIESVKNSLLKTFDTALIKKEIIKNANNIAVFEFENIVEEFKNLYLEAAHK